MTVTKSDVYIFHNAEETEKALEKMRRAIGKKYGATAAVKFAHAMLDLWGERKTIENEAERKRLDLLYAYYKINAVNNQVRQVVEYASGLAGKAYDEYTALGATGLKKKHAAPARPLRKQETRNTARNPLA